MVFVYPYKRKKDDFLINKSIELVNSYYDDAEIVIIGDNTNIENTKFIPFKSKDKIRGVNVTKKLLHVADLYDNFIFMNDDFLISRRLDFNYVGFSESLSTKYGKASVEWNQSVINTRDYLIHFGYNTYSFENHFPVLLESSKLKELFNIIDYKYYPHFIKSLYFNVFPCEFYDIENVKVNTTNKEKVKYYFDKYGCVSIGEGFTDKEFIKALK